MAVVVRFGAFSFAPSGLGLFRSFSHRLRGGLHSCAASRLRVCHSTRFAGRTLGLSSGQAASAPTQKSPLLATAARSGAPSAYAQSHLFDEDHPQRGCSSGLMPSAVFATISWVRNEFEG